MLQSEQYSKGLYCSKCELRQAAHVVLTFPFPPAAAPLNSPAPFLQTPSVFEHRILGSA